MQKVYQSGNSKFFSYIFSEEEKRFIVDAYSKKHWGTPTIAKHFGVSPTTINSLLRKCCVAFRDNREQALKFTCNEHYFDTIDSEHKAYWLGFLYADGYVSSPAKNSSGKVGLAIHVKDVQILQKFKNDIEYSGPINSYTQPTSYGTTSFSRIVIASNILYNSVVSKGVLPSKTFILKFPSSDMVPTNLQKHFIRGYLDGDGCITRGSSVKTNVYSIKFCGTYEMLCGIKKCFNTEHLRLEHKKTLLDKNNYQLTIGGNNQVRRILNWLYGEASIYLERKFQLARQAIKKERGFDE